MPISEQEETRRGEILVRVLKLKESKRKRGMIPPRYDTTYGTKTALGLFRVVQGIVTGDYEP